MSSHHLVDDKHSEPNNRGRKGGSAISRLDFQTELQIRKWGSRRSVEQRQCTTKEMSFHATP